MTSWTETLGRAIGEYRCQTIPDEVGLIARSSVLDWLGVASAAAQAAPVVAVRAATATPAPGLDARQEDGTATVIGTRRRAHMLVAARVNATAGHLLDFDDVLSPFGHPTAPVLPAALALAEAHALNGERLIRALVAGIETEYRIDRAAGPSHYEHGFHSTATHGTLGAAAAAAVLLNLDLEQSSQALGLASLSASGVKSAFGTWGKSLQVGHAAAEGLLSALLAQEGCSAPRIEDQQGYLATHSASIDLEAGASLVGEPWAIRDVLFKYHASCFGTHSSIEALIRLRHRLEPDDIESIVLKVSEKHLGMCDKTRVRTPLEAKFSLAFTAALALVRGRAGVDDFDTASVGDRELQHLASKVVVVPCQDASFGRTEVTVRLADGRLLHDAVDIEVPARGGELDVQWERLAEKFTSLVEPRIGQRKASHVVSLVRDLDELHDVRAVMSAVVAPSDPDPPRREQR